jgi:hypothetical protein
MAPCVRKNVATTKPTVKKAAAPAVKKAAAAKPAAAKPAVKKPAAKKTAAPKAEEEEKASPRQASTAPAYSTASTPGKKSALNPSGEWLFPTGLRPK